MVNSWERFILNPESHVAHDATHLSEECNTDQIERRVRKPSIPPGFRLCRHCAANIVAAGDAWPEGIEVETLVAQGAVEVGDGPAKLEPEQAASEVHSAEESAEGVRAPGVDAGGGDSGAPGGVDSEGPGGAGGPGGADVSGDAGAGPAQGAPADAAAVAAGGGDDGRPGDAGVPADTQAAELAPGALTAMHRGPAGPLDRMHVADIANSSNLRRLEWNAFERTMLVRFTNGWEYVYGNVPETLYTAILAAESPGHAFDELVKKADPKLPYEKVTKE